MLGLRIGGANKNAKRYAAENMVSCATFAGIIAFFHHLLSECVILN